MNSRHFHVLTGILWLGSACTESTPADGGGEPAGGSDSGAGGTGSGANGGGGTGTGGTGGTGGGVGAGSQGGGTSGLACASGAVLERCETALDDDGDGAECAEWSHLYGNGEQQFALKPTITSLGDVYFAGGLSFNGIGGGLMFGGQSYTEDPFFHTFVARLGADGEEQWLKPMPWSSAIVATQDGGVIVSIGMSRAEDFGGGELPYFGLGTTAIVSYDAQGQYQWGRVLLASGNFYFDRAVVAPDGDVVLSGALVGTLDTGNELLQTDDLDDLVLMKIDGTDGSTQWTRIVSSQVDGDSHPLFSARVAVDADGNVIWGGLFSGTISLGGAEIPSVTASTSFLARFDAAGNHLWSRRYCSNCQVIELAADEDGAAIVTGLFAQSTFFDPAEPSVPSLGSVDVFLGKVAVDQSYVWTKTFGSAEVDNAHSVGVTCDGDIVGTFVFEEEVNVGDELVSPGTAVIKFSSDGERLWHRVIPSGGQCELATASSGETALACTAVSGVDFGAGVHVSPNPGMTDIAVAKLAP